MKSSTLLADNEAQALDNRAQVSGRGLAGQRRENVAQEVARVVRLLALPPVPAVLAAGRVESRVYVPAATRLAARRADPAGSTSCALRVLLAGDVLFGGVTSAAAPPEGDSGGVKGGRFGGAWSF